MAETRRETPQRELLYYTGSNYAEIKTAWDEYYKWAAYPPALIDRGTHLMIEGGGMPPTRVDAGWAIARKPLEWYREPMYSPEAIAAYYADTASTFSIQQTTAAVPKLQVNVNTTIPVTWPKAFLDTDYAVIPVPVGAGGMMGIGVQSKTTTGCVLAVKALLGLSTGGTIQVTGIHP